MTKEQAIQEVKNYDNYPNGLSKECREYIIKTLEQDNKDIFKKFKKKAFLESEDILGNEMVDSYMITDYLAELLGVEND
jgi:hypothetical protein